MADRESKPKASAPVTTRTGDDGYTSLLGPERVAKYSPRPETFGTLDEATSALGLARAVCDDPVVSEHILELQQGLYKLMAELATPASEYGKIAFVMESSNVARLDQLSEELKCHVEIGKRFITPGATTCGAALDLARTIVRRGERLTARLSHDGEIANPHVLEWLNRLSDTIFILARYVERDHDQET
ncbi:MAG TPA: cob(I)yrinic acid a,c-diamide adenosyltransferase [Chloroflexota bacterium]|jgi:cob(I)alamin adenosyltransferase|nr:cob(I)yrinic acid a,c-diamide adenosyltransferase [Chloroflexota bacterium]